jgi:CHAD domain-containing protein
MALDPNYVKQTSKKLRKFLGKKGRSLSPDRVHKLRTTIRRVEATAAAILPKPKRRDKATLRLAKDIRKQAGKVRDMDVLMADALDIRIPTGERERLVQLLEYLGSKRRKEAKKLKRLIQTEGPGLRQGAKYLSANVRRRIEKQARRDGRGAVPEVLAKTVDLLSDLKNPPKLNPRNLHPYRLKVKELRDVIRVSPQVGDSRLADALGKVKDAIGDWHDWQELGLIADRVLQEPSQAVTKSIKTTTEQKYERALSLAQRMRQQFVSSKKAGLKQSVVKTAAGMAN